MMHKNVFSFDDCLEKLNEETFAITQCVRKSLSDRTIKEVVCRMTRFLKLPYKIEISLFI